MALAAAGGMLFSGGQDASIRAWKFNPEATRFEPGVCAQPSSHRLAHGIGHLLHDNGNPCVMRVWQRYRHCEVQCAVVNVTEMTGNDGICDTICDQAVCTLNSKGPGASVVGACACVLCILVLKVYVLMSVGVAFWCCDRHSSPQRKAATQRLSVLWSLQISFCSQQTLMAASR